MASDGPNREQMLRMAVNSAKQGNVAGARMMFQQVINGDPNNERAMLWMAKIAESPAQRQMWLNRVIAVNPNNPVAQKALSKLQSRQTQSESRTLIYYGSIAVAAVLMLVLVLTAVWAFAPIRL